MNTEENKNDDFSQEENVENSNNLLAEENKADDVKEFQEEEIESDNSENNNDLDSEKEKTDEDSSTEAKEKESEESEEDLEEKTDEDEKHEASSIKDHSVLYMKGLRIAIDNDMQKVAFYLGVKSNAHLSLFRAKAWLGKVLGIIGNPNPYETKEKIENRNEIPATQEVAKSDLRQFDLLGEIDKVVSIRESIEKHIEKLPSADDLNVDSSRQLSICLTQAYIHLSEARFDLGNQLSIIKNR